MKEFLVATQAFAHSPQGCASKWVTRGPAADGGDRFEGISTASNRDGIHRRLIR